MATGSKYQEFVKNLGDAKIACGTHVFKVALTNTAPNLGTNAVLADITEIGAGNGYSAGGATIPNTAYSEAAGVGSLIGDMAEITAAGGSIGPFRYAVVYDDTQTSPADPLFAVWDYGSAITLASGEKFQFKPSSATTGGTIMTVT